MQQYPYPIIIRNNGETIYEELEKLVDGPQVELYGFNLRVPFMVDDVIRATDDDYYYFIIRLESYYGDLTRIEIKYSKNGPTPSGWDTK